MLLDAQIELEENDLPFSDPFFVETVRCGEERGNEGNTVMNEKWR